MTTLDLGAVSAQTAIMTQGMTDFVHFQATILEGISQAKLDEPSGQCTVRGTTHPRQDMEHVKIQMANTRRRLGHSLHWELTITQDMRTDHLTSMFVVTLNPTWAQGTIPLVLRQRVCSHPEGTRERQLANAYPWTFDIYDYGGGKTVLSHHHLAADTRELTGTSGAIRKTLAQKIRLVLPDTQKRILTRDEALAGVQVMTRAFLRLE